MIAADPRRGAICCGGLLVPLVVSGGVFVVFEGFEAILSLDEHGRCGAGVHPVDASLDAAEKHGEGHGEEGDFHGGVGNKISLGSRMRLPPREADDEVKQVGDDAEDEHQEGQRVGPPAGEGGDEVLFVGEGVVERRFERDTSVASAVEAEDQARGLVQGPIRRRLGRLWEEGEEPSGGRRICWRRSSRRHGYDATYPRRA
mmetsp:Transcript_12545/g.41051  ORF Transcript_12545/g.41051 Transcript_12545/m.41051 type:complete len:201 (+) Transcript_12545:214-816(+)